MQDPIAPLRIVATNEHFAAVSDDLDMSPADLDAYRRTRDEALVRAKPGRAPTWFVVQRLPAIVIPTLARMSADELRDQTAFLMACHLVETPTLKHEPEARQYASGIGGTRLAGDDWFNACARRWGVETCLEVGRVAFQWARLPEGAVGFFR